MGLQITNALNAYIVKEDSYIERSYVLDFFSYYSANALVDNDELSAIELINGELRGVALSDILIAVTGKSENIEFRIDKVKAPLWQTIYVPKESEIEVKCKKQSVAYLAIKGLVVENNLVKKALNKEVLQVAYAPKESIVNELPARRIPAHIIHEYFNTPLRVIFNHGGMDKRRILFKVERKELLKGIVLNCLEELTGKIKPQRLKYGALKIGSCIKTLSGKLFVTLNHVTVDGCLIAKIHPCDVDKLVNLNEGDIVEARVIDRKAYNTVFEHYNNFLQRIKSCIRASINALKRGAKLVRVKLGSKVYELWVEEIK